MAAKTAWIFPNVSNVGCSPRARRDDSRSGGEEEPGDFFCLHNSHVSCILPMQLNHANRLRSIFSAARELHTDSRWGGASDYMWNDKFRLSEAAEMIGVPFRFLRGWLERDLIKTAGLDDSRPGHPHLVTFTEVIRLAVAVEVQRLITVRPNAKWNPGSFLAPFREGIPDQTLQHIPKGSTGGTRLLGWREDVALRKRMEEETLHRPKDLLLMISVFRDKQGEVQEIIEISLASFRESLSIFLVMNTAWMLINVSNVVRRLLTSRENLEKKRQNFGLKSRQRGAG